MDSPPRARSPGRRLVKKSPNIRAYERPYLTHTTGHSTLVPPQNNGRIRKSRSKSKTRAPIYDDVNSVASGSRCNSPTSSTTASTRDLVANRTLRKRKSRSPSHTSTLDQNADPGPSALRMEFPTDPPPSFEEAVPHHSTWRHSMPIPRSSPIEPHSPSIQSLPSSDPDPDFCEDTDGSSVDIEIISSTKEGGTPVGLSEWELDLRAGFTLEERVKREWDRRHAEGIPTPVMVPDPPPLPDKTSPRPEDTKSIESPVDSVVSPLSTHSAPVAGSVKTVVVEPGWELVEEVTADSNSPGDRRKMLPDNRTPSEIRGKRSVPPPPPPLRRSYGREAADAKTQSTKVPMANTKKRRTPPPIPRRKGVSQTRETTDNNDPPEAHQTSEAADSSSTLLRAFDPLCQSHQNLGPVSDELERLQAIAPAPRPLPTPPDQPSSPALTAFAAFQQDPSLAADTSRIHELIVSQEARTIQASGTSIPISQQQRGEGSEEYENITDLDVLVSRLENEGGGAAQGDHYDELLIVGEILGEVVPSVKPARLSALEGIPVGKVEITSRRTTKDGRVKLKLSLLGVKVDKCSVCLSQFKAGVSGAVLQGCGHCFHETCLTRWLRHNDTCPSCRASISEE